MIFICANNLNLNTINLSKYRCTNYKTDKSNCITCIFSKIFPTFTLLNPPKSLNKKLANHKNFISCILMERRKISFGNHN